MLAGTAAFIAHRGHLAKAPIILSGVVSRPQAKVRGAKIKHPMTQLANYHKMIPVDDVVDLIDKAEKVELPANGKTDRTQCLNSLLDDLVGVYDATMRKYRSKKGDQYVPSKRGDFAESYANADEELSLDDSDYVPVAVAKADKDGLFFYIKTLHTVDVCAYKADPDNARAVSVHPLLFDMDANMDTKCKKAIDAVEHFEQVGL